MRLFNRRGIGADAESRALDHLLKQGCKLIARNWNTRGGELDLIVRDDEGLIFVEVRSRSHSGFGGAAGSVDGRKRARIIHGARAFLAKHPALAHLPARFDVVAIEADGKLGWIVNAFDAEAF